MATRWLALTALALTLAAPAGATWKTSACKEECMAAHDSKELACKTVDTKEKKACLSRAQAARRSCEADCARKYPEHEKPRPKKHAHKQPDVPASPDAAHGGPGKT